MFVGILWSERAQRVRHEIMYVSNVTYPVCAGVVSKMRTSRLPLFVYQQEWLTFVDMYMHRLKAKP